MRRTWRLVTSVLAAAAGADACSLAMLSDIEAITPICCGGEEAADCSEGFPARCSPSCASLIVPFWDDCQGTMALMGPGFYTFDVYRAPPPPAFVRSPLHA